MLANTAIGERELHFEITLQPFQNILRICPLEPRLVPVIDLQAEEDTEHDDQRLHRDGEPVLLA